MAQGADPHISIQLIGPDQGLPNRNTRCITQDNAGFLWLSAGTGLWRYDGYSFENYSSLLTLSSGPITFINDIQKGPGNKIWIAHNNGISIVDPVTFHCVSKDLTLFFPAQLASKQAVKIHFDTRGNTWVALPGNMLAKLDTAGKPLLLFTTPESKPDAPFDKSFIISFFEDGAGSLYLFSKNNFIDVIDTDGRYQRRIELLSSSMRKQFNAYAVVFPGREELQIYYRQKVLQKTLVQTYSFTKQALAPLQENPFFLTPEICHTDAKGFVWYKNGKEIGMLNRATGKLIKLTEQLQQKSGIETYYFDAFVGSDNSFWLCSNAGLFRLNINEQFFQQYLSIPLQKPGDVGTSVRGITEDSTGALWICSYGFKAGGTTHLLHKLIPHTDNVTHPKLLPAKGSTITNYILYKSVFLHGNMYTITDGKILLKIAAQNLQLSVIEFPAVTGNEFVSIYVINDSTLWMGLLSGMAMMNTKTEQPVLLNNKKGNYIQNVRINYFMPWPANRILASTSNGLYVLDKEARIIEHYGNAPGDKISLPSQRIYYTSWYQNNLWAGSADGLVRIDTIHKKAEIFTTQEGLPDNTIYAALPDERGNLWLSTNYGLCRFNAVTKQVHNYGLADGLPHMEFNNASFLKASDGKMYFGGLNGVVGFDPAKIDIAGESADSLRLISYSKYVADSNRIITVTGNGSENKIVFKPGDRLFSFSFMSPDYRNMGQTRFRYKLEGWGNDDWHPFESGNRLLFNSLPPGDYTLHVQISVGGTNWSPKEWRATIKVKAPWYKTVWFYVCSLLAVSGICYFFYRNRLAQIVRIQQIRNRISADMHDEIGSTLSSISFYSQALLMQTGETAHREVLQKIKENAQQVQEGLSDIIWSVKADMDEIENVSARMFSFGSELLETKGILFHFKIDDQRQRVKLDMARRKNLYLIFKESLHNAAKYAQCKNVWVHIEIKDQQAKMVIKDDGIGFDPMNTKQGNGLSNMKERAVQMKGRLLIETVENAGTTITLRF